MTEGGPTWLYFKFYPGSVDLMDRVVLDVAAPVAGGHPTSRWFFLRYFDGAGPHVRLRLLLPLAAADALAGQRPALLEQLEGLGRGASGSRIASARVTLDLYEPEYAKWGGAPYLPVAEQVFQESSSLAITLLRSIRATTADRLALGCLLMTELLTTFALDDATRTGFLRTHYRWWSGSTHDEGGRRDRDLQAAFDHQAGTVLERANALADAEIVSRSVRKFAGIVRSSVARSNPAQKPLFLVFHQLHLMLNRLGTLPDDEAMVSLLTRSRMDQT